MKIKGLCLLLALILCFSAALCACGKDEEKTPAKKTEDKTEVSENVSQEASELSDENSSNESGELSEESELSLEVSEESFEESIESEDTESVESAEDSTPVESSEAAEESDVESVESVEESVDIDSSAVESEPVESEPVESEPVESEPVESEPVESEPVESEPVESEPVESEPVESEPVESEPVESEPVESEPVESEPEESVEEIPAETEYSVNLTNPDGTPCKSGAIVKFMQNGTQAAIQAPNADGIAKKVLPTGDYTVEITFTSADSALFYDKKGLELNAENNEITIQLLNGLTGEPTTVYQSGDPYEAYSVSVGSTYTELTEGKNYYLFAPTVAGTYEFTTSDKKALIGYHGNRHFIQENNIAEVVRQNVISISVSASGISSAGAGSTEFVLAIDAAAGIGECVLIITRVGDAEVSLADLPWTKYQTTATLSEYTVPQGTKLTNFNLKAGSDEYKLVYNESDGFYHLNTANGPLVYVWLTEEPPYLASFKTMLEHSGVNKYFFKEDGSFEKKEDYGDCLLEYIECADDDKGVYPLTKDLEYIIKNRGDFVGWWDFDSHGCIFFDRNGNPDKAINTDLAWLFMCCYAG